MLRLRLPVPVRTSRSQRGGWRPKATVQNELDFLVLTFYIKVLAPL